MSADADLLDVFYQDLGKKLLASKNNNNNNNKLNSSKKTATSTQGNSSCSPSHHQQQNCTRKKKKQSMPVSNKKVEFPVVQPNQVDEVLYTIDLSDSDYEILSQEGTGKSSPSSSLGRLLPTPLPYSSSSCCRKCKCCIRPFPTTHAFRSHEIAIRLKEKTNKKKEMELKCEEFSEYLLSEVKNANRGRSQSNDSDMTCVYDDSCRCKECLKRAKICAELIAEEESNKKKKQKKKKKKQKKNEANDNEDDDEYEGTQNNDNNLKDIEEEEFSYNPPVMFFDGTGNGNHLHTKLANPIEAIAAEQWIPVKTKSKAEQLAKANKSVPATPIAAEKIETNFTSEQKKKVSNVDSIAKDLSACSLNDSMKNAASSVSNSNTNLLAQLCPLTNVQKARLMAIDADLADKRDEIYYAIELITEAIGLDPKNASFYINRAFYYDRMMKYQKALDDAERALDIEEKAGVDEFKEYSLFRRAHAYEGLEEFENAEKGYLEFLKTIEEKVIKCGNNNIQPFEALLPRIEKNLLILRIKKMVKDGYHLILARLYASRFSTIQECIENIRANLKTLKHNSQAQNPALMLQFHLQIFALQDSNGGNDGLRRNPLYNQNGDVDSDEEIYMSDDDEYDLLYSKDRFCSNSKEILSMKINPNQSYTDEFHEQLNSRGQKALWVGNVAPNCDATLATSMFSKFGNVTFCRTFTNENPVDHSNDVGYLLLHYDNDISPKLVMAYFKEEVIPGISKDNSYPLLIRFRNKNEKMEEESHENNIQKDAYKQYNNQTSIGNNINIGNNNNTTPNAHNNSINKQATSECYYWRTTGCDRERCNFKHIPSSKGIDKQHWMRRKH